MPVCSAKASRAWESGCAGMSACSVAGATSWVGAAWASMSARVVHTDSARSTADTAFAISGDGWCEETSPLCFGHLRTPWVHFTVKAQLTRTVRCSNALTGGKEGDPLTLLLA